jgi:hypothetical protein
MSHDPTRRSLLAAAAAASTSATLTSATRFSVGAAAGLASLAAVAPAARAQARWPERPLKLIVPYPPGGNADAIGRWAAERLHLEPLRPAAQARPHGPVVPRLKPPPHETHIP